MEGSQMASNGYAQSAADYRRVEQAILFLEKNFPQQPSLKEIAGNVGVSEFHFQRLFARWVGISPKRFLQFLTKEYAKQLLAESRSVLDVSYESGLSGPGRLHDLFVACEAVTPGEFKNKGTGLSITYGFHPSPFGECLLAVTERGVCGLSLGPVSGRKRMLASLKKSWKRARFTEDSNGTRALVRRVFALFGKAKPAPLHLFFQGTNFQLKVWEALLRIPAGSVVTYQDIARHIGMPLAARAVGNAVGQNPIPFLIPCHRVIRKSGQSGNYGLGPARKKAILGWEAALTAHSPQQQ